MYVSVWVVEVYEWGSGCKWVGKVVGESMWVRVVGVSGWVRQWVYVSWWVVDVGECMG